MEMAFPSSDYYGGSVAIGLAPLRQSCIPYLNDDQDGLGAHFVPLRVLITPQLPRSVLGRRSIHPPIVQGALDINHRFQPVLSTVWVLGFSGVGGWRGARFTPEFVYASVCIGSDGQPASSPFPSASPRTVRARFPSTRLSSGRILRRSAFDITSTWFLIVPVHLTRFAMWPAFPAADYYRVSVTMGLAPCRRSRAFPKTYGSAI